ncbi:MAG: cell wall biosynthesis protein [Methanobacteriaceae archaeon]|nr:MAG: cell wall biosynthesis protein [Methanobacterium sp. BRmetb2]MCC7558535.1 cell wall biosynthesis protein [Methanobacteriaceae archaeon]
MDLKLSLLAVFIVSAFLTVLLKVIFEKVGGNLYTSVRGGTPRAVGLAPFIAMILFLPSPYRDLILIIGVFAFLDDIIGRKKIKNLPVEIGQLLRGLGMLMVAYVGYFYFGPASILIALMVQPLNIADMQPGSACSTVIIMSAIILLSMFYFGILGLYVPLVVLIACLGYAILDFQGKIMMGEIGNHSFAVALGMSYAVLGGFWGTLLLFILTVIVIALIRRNNLTKFMQNNLKIMDPSFGDFFMDVLTGGGLGDILRRILLGKRRIIINNKLLKFLGFRRLFYNPFAPHSVL